MNERSPLRGVKPLYIVVTGIVFLFFGHINSGRAQSDQYPKINFAGMFQPRISYGIADDSTTTAYRFGFGIRRARLRMEARLLEKVGMRYHADFTRGLVRTVDLFAFYQLSNRVRIRMGVMASAMPRSRNLTSSRLIDGIDRAVIAEQWGRVTIGGSGRDFGVDVQYEVPDWTAILFLHNGDGSFDRSRGNYSESISSEAATGGISRSILATSFYVAHRFPSLKGVEVGAYLGQNASRNPNTAGESGQGRDYWSYAGHIYYGAEPGSQPVRLKLDVIGINFNGEEREEWIGVSLLGAVRLRDHMELFARYENAKEDAQLDGTSFISGGLIFSVSKLNGGNYSDQRATLGYSMLDSSTGKQQHLIVLQWQFVL